MIQRFGGQVQGRMSKKTSKYSRIYSLMISSLISHNNLTLFDTDYLLVGKQPNGDKFKSAANNKVEIINLQRLWNLLLGILTLESLKQMNKLEKETFSKKNYEEALLQEPSSTNSATANNDETANNDATLAE